MVRKIQGIIERLRISTVCLLLGDIWLHVCKWSQCFAFAFWRNVIVKAKFGLFFANLLYNKSNVETLALNLVLAFLLPQVGTYAAITVGGLDAMDIIARFDQFTGFELAQKVDPALGKMGLCLALNECWEPIRLPFVVATLKPIMETISPPKY